MTWRKALAIGALVVTVLNEAWMASLIQGNIALFVFQNGKAPCVYGVIRDDSTLLSFPWFVVTLFCSLMVWRPIWWRWLHYVLAAIAVSEFSFLMSFALLYPGRPPA